MWAGSLVLGTCVSHKYLGGGVRFARLGDPFSSLAELEKIMALPPRYSDRTPNK